MMGGLNLMTQQAFARRAVSEAKRRWLMGATLLVAIQAAVAATLWADEASLRDKHFTAAAQYDPVRIIVQENQRLETRIADLRKEHAELLETSVRRPVTVLLTNLAEACLAVDRQVVVTHLNVELPRPSWKQAAATPGSMLVETVCPFDVDINPFVQTLREGPSERVEIVRSESRLDNDGHWQVHTFRCEWDLGETTSR
ncbi:MAG: hypothetical protein KDA61_22380 [Planctomycetales bacterium]|nr:hypothetical protein [Planctomycetales bacterium]